MMSRVVKQKLFGAGGDVDADVNYSMSADDHGAHAVTSAPARPNVVTTRALAKADLAASKGKPKAKAAGGGDNNSVAVVKMASSGDATKARK